MKTLWPDNVETDVGFQGEQLKFCFNIKEKLKVLHKHDLVGLGEYPGESRNFDYVGKTSKYALKRLIDHSGNDKNAHVLKHQIEKEHPCPQYDSFKIISRNNTK